MTQTPSITRNNARPAAATKEPKSNRQPPSESQVSTQSQIGLNAANFFLAEITGVVMPFLGAYLQVRHWSETAIGVAVSLAGLGVFLMQTPAGMIVDRVRQRRTLLAAASIVVGICYGLLPLVPAQPGWVDSILFVAGTAQAFFLPLLGALALGLVGHAALNRTVGHNQGWNHAGNLAAALLAMALVGEFGVESVFYAVPIVSILAAGSVFVIRNEEIDEDRASGAATGGGKAIGLRELLQDRRVLVLLLATALFHLANAPVMPFLGAYIKTLKGNDVQVAAVVLVAQVVMIPVALAAGALCDRWGRKWVFGIGLVVLPIRIFLYTLTQDPWTLVALQTLDGIGAGIYGVVIVAICADLTKGKGGFNALSGMIATALAVGGVIGPLGAGYLAEHLGFNGFFYVFTGIAVLAAVLFLSLMPETRDENQHRGIRREREHTVNEQTVWLTWIIFVVTYAGLALGKIPGLRMDRAGIALVGATLMLIAGVLSLDQAVSSDSIDFKTLVLLFGMMIVVGALRLSGFFERLVDVALRRIHTPHGLLAVTIGLSGVLSAFLINDVVCVALTPLVLHLARRMKFDPIPHLIGLASAANVGSTGTITGNPQNIYIGVHSGISYLRFAARLLPVAMLGLCVTYVVVCLVYRSRLVPPPKADSNEMDEPSLSGEPEGKPPRRVHARLQLKSVLVTLTAVALFFTGLPLELVALGAAAVVLLDRVKPKKLYDEVDWSLLVMFTGLFIVVHAFQVNVVSRWGVENWQWLLSRPVDLLSVVSAGLSNVVSNVPAVLLLEPVARAVPTETRESAWLALAMSSTFAGNLTVLGSVANLIVVEIADRKGVTISFWEYCKVGIPLTVLTLGLGIAWLKFIPY